MYLYIIFSVLSVLAILEVCRIKFKGLPLFYNYAYIFIISVIFLLSMLRWENGTDWASYFNYFNSVGKNLNTGYMEIGYTLLCYLGYNYLNYTLFLGIIGFLSIVPVAIRIKEYSHFPLLALLIWFSTSFAHMFPVRQTVAVSLFIFSWKYIQNRRLFPFICIIAAASTFHLPVLITLPIYFIWNKYIPAKIFISIILGLFFLSIISNNIFSNFFYSLGNIGNSYIEDKINAYMDNSDETFGSVYSPFQVLVRGCINRSFYFFLPLMLLNEKRKENSVMNAVFNMYFYSFSLFLIVTPLSMALGRLTSYTDISQLFLLPFLFTLKMNKKNTILIITIIVLYLSLRFNGVVSNYKDLYIPYHSVLFK